jgi:hypothetical protein
MARGKAVCLLFVLRVCAKIWKVEKMTLNMVKISRSKTWKSFDEFPTDKNQEFIWVWLYEMELD